MQKKFFFTHIPKTAGTTFLKSIIKPNFKQNQIYETGSLKQTAIDCIKGRFKYRDVRVIEGHFKYGLHIFLSCNPLYITFLRDPIDRAISYYYFIKDSDTKYYKHPLRDYADSVTIEKFYKNPRFANMQAQFIAGYIDSFANKVSDKKFFVLPYPKSCLLKRAKYNLFNRYLCYGIFEYFDRSKIIIKEKLGLHLCDNNISIEKKTKKRPKVLDLPEQTLAHLRRYNDLDIELYEVAKKRFNLQFSLVEEARYIF